MTELYFYELLYIISFGTPADWRCASTGRISSQDKTWRDIQLPNRTFSWASLNKWLTSSSCTYFRLTYLSLHLFIRHTPSYEYYVPDNNLVRVFSDILVAFLYFDICHYICGKYQNIEKPLKHQRRLGLTTTLLEIQKYYLNDSAEGRRFTMEIFFMINLYESTERGQDQTHDPWICSQTRICSQTHY